MEYLDYYCKKLNEESDRVFRVLALLKPDEKIRWEGANKWAGAAVKASIVDQASGESLTWAAVMIRKYDREQLDIEKSLASEVPKDVTDEIKLVTGYTIREEGTTSSTRAISTVVTSIVPDIDSMEERIQAAIDAQTFARHLLDEKEKYMTVGAYVRMKQHLGVDESTDRFYLNPKLGRRQRISLIYTPSELRIMSRMGMEAVTNSLFELRGQHDVPNYHLLALGPHIERFENALKLYQ
jgi:hypothetical protein